ncbi:MAG: rane dipeptidase [Streptosporangiaceae bacterium]|nr:rane dipeptidase [Streptosporangiaceae bacterium]
MGGAPEAPGSRARGLLARVPLLDGHNDLPWALREAGCAGLDGTDLSQRVSFTQTDLPRLAAGGVGAQFWSVYVPSTLAGESAVAATLEQIDLVRRMIQLYPGELGLALTADDVQRVFAAGRIASLLGAEGGHSIASSMGVLRALYALGVRYLTLTHNANVPWADSATDQPRAGGLTEFGRAVVREMQRLGMLTDLSHVSPATMSDALDVAEAPVIFSHSSARALCDHPRNVPDDILARLPGNRGVCMVTFVASFVSPDCWAWERELTAEMERRGADPWELSARDRLRREMTAATPRSQATRAGATLPRATLAQVAGHIEHVREVAGVDHVGLGGDFDGTDQLPDGLADVSCYPALLAELLSRGWTEEDCAKLAGGNILRVMHEAEVAARELSRQRPPSTARIEDLDGH